jgi:hypothetical protein
MILTVVNDHPLAPLMSAFAEQRTLLGPDNIGWSVDRELVGIGTLSENQFLGNMLPTLLPPFDLSVYYASELASESRLSGNDAVEKKAVSTLWRYGPRGAGLLIRGIEFRDDGFVTSVNDMVSEVTLSFMAFDYKPLAPLDMVARGSSDMPDGYRLAPDFNTELRRRLGG